MFSDLKALYSNTGKRAAIQTIAEAILAKQGAVASGTCRLGPICGPGAELSNLIDSSLREPPTTLVWSLYFLAQHYATASETLGKALELLQQAIMHTPTLPELYMAQARVLKRSGDILGASATMTAAWRLDLQDRFLNTKNAKYLLRAGFVEEANAMLGLFTRVCCLCFHHSSKVIGLGTLPYS